MESNARAMARVGSEPSLARHTRNVPAARRCRARRSRSAARATGSTATRTISSAMARLAPVDVARSRSTGGTYLWCFGTWNLGPGDVDEARGDFSTGSPSGSGETESGRARVASWSRVDASWPARLVSPSQSSRPMAASHALRIAYRGTSSANFGASPRARSVRYTSAAVLSDVPGAHMRRRTTSARSTFASRKTRAPGASVSLSLFIVSLEVD